MVSAVDSLQEQLSGGIVPAVVNPWTEDYELEREQLRSHVTSLAAVDGVVALICNAHAGECKLTTRETKREVLRVATEAAGDVPVFAGVGGESSLRSIELARDAVEEGADAVMLLPLDTYSKGVAEEPITHFRLVADAVDVPLINFQFPTWGGPGVPIEAHREICSMSQVVGFKEASFDPVRTERTFRELGATREEVVLLAGSDTFLFHSYLLGADSALISYGNLIPELHVEKLRAVHDGDLERAREIREEMLPLTNFLFAKPQANYLPRVKAALEMQGTFSRATILPPQSHNDGAERERLREILDDLGAL